MSVAIKFSSWQSSYPTPEGTTFTAASPNLVKIVEDAKKRFGMTSLGIYNKRPIRGGTAWSSHAYGAAADLGYKNRADAETAIAFYIENSAELGIQRVHDYKAKRYWQAGKGWIERPPGDGDMWIHVEVHPSAWADTRTVDARIGAQNAPQAPAPASSTAKPAYPGKPLKKGSKGAAVVQLQERLCIKADGDFGAATEKHVRNFQTEYQLTVDGVVGPQTWAALFP